VNSSVSGDRDRNAFSLVELMVVLGVLSLAMAIVGGSLMTLRSTHLSVASGKFADFVNLCRAQAIAGHTAVRVGVVTSSPGNPEEEYRKYSAWKWSKRSRKFEQFAAWEALPPEISFEPQAPDYVRDADYFASDPSAVRGDHVFSLEDNEFETTDIDGNRRSLSFVEFSPAGRASTPSGELRNLVFVARHGQPDLIPDEIENWCQFNIDTLTGRIQIHRP